MTAGRLLLVVAGLLVPAGALLIAAGLRRVDGSRGPVPTAPARLRWRLRSLHLLAAAAALGALLLTGWPVAALGAAGAVLYLPAVLGGAAAARQLITRSEALAAWTRHLADLIASGAASSTVEALRRSAASAPAPITAAVRALVDRLGPQGPETALRRFADDVADPLADKIAMVLILRERNGGRGLAEVLTALADDLDERTRMLRELEAERAKPRANMRTIVTVTGVLVVGMLLFTRPFLATYGTAAGEVGLAVVAALFGWALRWMRGLACPEPTTRVLIRRATAARGAVS